MGHEIHDTTPSGGSVSSDCRVTAELLEGGARDKFSLLQTGDLHGAFVQEVLQFCVAVTNAVAVELQDVAFPEVCVWPRCSATVEVREGDGWGGGRASRDYWKRRKVREGRD